MTIYYAHPISTYGSEQQRQDIATLEALGFEVINPDAPEKAEGYEREGMAFFFRLINEKADALAIRTFDDGKISAGAAKELAHAKAQGLPVFELPSAVEERTLTVAETRERLRRAGR